MMYRRRLEFSCSRVHAVRQIPTTTASSRKMLKSMDVELEAFHSIPGRSLAELGMSGHADVSECKWVTGRELTTSSEHVDRRYAARAPVRTRSAP
jgi:hypothetical protein